MPSVWITGRDMILSLGNGDGDTHEGSPSLRRRLEPQRVILILTRTGSISDRLIDALEREFPRMLIEQVDNVEAACETFLYPVALILVDFALMKEAEAAAAVLRRMHPYALTAVIQPSDKRSLSSLADVARSPLIRSVLPMNLKLDIWLSIIRLMLCGGEYFPLETIMQARSESRAANTFPPEGADTGSEDRERSLATLTVREMQILEMAARGLQNKLIAAEFNLSEHTVKVHLHNIIRKLGVHNRTEAAARFRIARESADTK